MYHRFYIGLRIDYVQVCLAICEYLEHTLFPMGIFKHGVYVGSRNILVACLKVYETKPPVGAVNPVNAHFPIHT